jgi:hypothetical protein
MQSNNGVPGRKPLLQAGSMLNIQGGTYQVVGPEPLGMGSFGAVWAAKRRDGVKGEVAIKEILCRSQKELTDATLEGRLLRMIHTTKSGHLGSKVPDLVAMETEALGPDQWVMRLAMTKVPGMQLDTFLEMCKAQTSRRMPNGASHPAYVAANNVAAQCQSLAGACRFARLLLAQLASMFDCMSAVVYHRDVSPHNVLVDVEHSSGPQYGLVDFGLGIDLHSWHGQKGQSSWHYVDIGGDCRYWPVSVWIMFIGGSDELERYPALAQEYQTRLDLHAVGITVLEVLLALLPAAALASEEMRNLQAAWNQYWHDATHFWKRTMQVFDSGQDPTRLKQWIRNEGRVLETLSTDLASLRHALRKAASACSRAPQGSTNCTPDGSRLFRTLLELISNCGKTGQEESVQQPSWQVVRTLIDSADGVPGGSATAPVMNGSMMASVPFFTQASGAFEVRGGSKFEVRGGSLNVSPPQGSMMQRTSSPGRRMQRTHDSPMAMTSRDTKLQASGLKPQLITTSHTQNGNTQYRDAMTASTGFQQSRVATSHYGSVQAVRSVQVVR